MVLKLTNLRVTCIKYISFDENSTSKIGIMNNFLSIRCYKLNRIKA
jgi:hypothetical protein